jgi:hypothetical protein
MRRERWIKSSYSNTQTACVEILFPTRDAVQDSKNPNGPVLTFQGTGLAAFLDKVRSDSQR